MLKWLSTTPNEGQTQTKTSNPNHKDEDTLAEHSERVSLDEQVPLTENSEEIGRDSSASEKVKFLAEANQPRNIKFCNIQLGNRIAHSNQPGSTSSHGFIMMNNQTLCCASLASKLCI